MPRLAALFVFLALVATLAPRAAWAAPSRPTGERVAASPAAVRRTAGPATRHGRGLAYRAGLHLGRLRGGAPIAAPRAVARLLGKVAGATALIAGAAVGAVAASAGLFEADHPVLGTGALAVTLLASIDPFWQFPGSRLAILGGELAEGFARGKASAARRARLEP